MILTCRPFNKGAVPDTCTFTCLKLSLVLYLLTLKSENQILIKVPLVNSEVLEHLKNIENPGLVNELVYIYIYIYIYREREREY